MPISSQEAAELAVSAYSVGNDEEAEGFITVLYEMQGTLPGNEAREALVAAGFPKALVVRMAHLAPKRPNELQKLHRRLLVYVTPQTADELLTEAFAAKAASKPGTIPRSRLYHIACDFASPQLVAKAFQRAGVPVADHVPRVPALSMLQATKG